MIGADSLIGWVSNGVTNAFTSRLISRGDNALGPNTLWGSFRFNGSEINGIFSCFSL